MNSLVIARAFLSLAVIVSLGGVAAGGGNSDSSQASLASFVTSSRSGENATTRHTNSFRGLREAWRQPASLSLDDSRRVLFPSAFAWVQAAPVDILPTFVPSSYRWAATNTQPQFGEFNGPFSALPEKTNSVSGEVGLFYGRSTGKYRREVEQAYILGEITQGNTQINVGASYSRSTGRGPRVIGP